MTEKEMMQRNIEEFSRLQDYMIEDGKDAKAYKTMLKRYLDLKAILQACGINLTYIEIKSHRGYIILLTAWEYMLPSVIANFPQFLLNIQKAVIFGNPLAPARRARFNLPRIQRHCQIRNCCIFRLPGAVGNNGRITIFLCKLNRLYRLRDCPNLVKLN